MVFPFGEHPPKKDEKRIMFDFVVAKSEKEALNLIEYLKYEEGCRNRYDIPPESMVGKSIAIDLFHRPHKSFGFTGIYVHAAQQYHGAKTFYRVDSFIKYRRHLSLN